MKSSAYVAAEPGAEMLRQEIEMPAMDAEDVLIKITHCGLCHSDLAVQFAGALGAEVTAIASSPDKEAEARAFGASHFLLTDQLDDCRAQVDLLLVTISGQRDWQPLLNTVRPFGVMCFLAMSLDAVNIAPLDLIAGQRQLVGSVIASPSQMVEMLEFSARHGIKPRIEEMPMTEINDAFQRLAVNQPRFRIVITAADAR